MSERLGRDLGLPVVHRDRLRHSVFAGVYDIDGVRDLLPAAGDRLVIEAVSLVVEAGVSVVLDGNFNTERHMAPVRALLEERTLNAVEVCLWGEPSELRRRFVERADPPLTPELAPYFESVLHRDRNSVVADATRVRHLDTTDPSTLDDRYADLKQWVLQRI